MKLLWLTDLHLDKTERKRRTLFYAMLRRMSADAVVITGDISDARYLPGHLRELGQACAPRPVYFVLGNHDFYGSGFADVDRAVAAVCKEKPNLHHLGQGEIIRLGAHDALVGHRGWADGRAGWGSRSPVWNPDHSAIDDFRSLSRRILWSRVEELGKASGKYHRRLAAPLGTIFKVDFLSVWRARKKPCGDGWKCSEPSLKKTPCAFRPSVAGRV